MPPARNQPQPQQIEPRRPNTINRSPSAPPLAAVPPPLPPLTTVSDSLPALPDGAIWEDPIVNRTGPHPVSSDLVAALKARPGQWARIRVYLHSSSPGSGGRSILKQLGPGWEWKGGKIADKQYGLWIRYNPAKEN